MRQGVRVIVCGHQPDSLSPSWQKEAPVQGYCVKCKAKKDIKGAKQIETKNKRTAVQGTCPDCGTKITVIGGKL